jgi:hypothetical protein
MTMASEPVRAPRRRVHQLRDDRLHGLDMRTQRGRQYLAAFRAACQEFPGADPSRVAQIVRLRLLAEREETDALAGRVSVNDAVRAANTVARFERDLHLTTKGKPAPGTQDLAAYLAELANREADDEPVETETDSGINKGHPLESAAASEHLTGREDIDVEADAP